MNDRKLSYVEAIEHLKDLVNVFNKNIDQKNTFLKKGIPSKEIDRELDKVLNDIYKITGERSIQHAKKVLAEYKGA